MKEKQVAEKLKKRKIRQVLTGLVVGTKMDKTISVSVYRSKKNEKYGKYVRKKVIFKAHDEKNKAREGDTVRIFETRPISKSKRWMLNQIVSKQEEQK